MASSNEHLVVESRPCKICKKPATADYDCGDCGHPNCGNHFQWCQTTDGKIRCTVCYIKHMEKSGGKKIK